MTSGIIEILIEDAGVQAIDGLQRSDDTYKVFPVVNMCKEGETQPYIVVFKSSNDPVTGKGCNGLLDIPQFTVQCYGKNFRQSELMFEAVRAALDNKQSTTTYYKFDWIRLANDRDGFDNENQVFVHQCEFQCQVDYSYTPT